MKANNSGVLSTASGLVFAGDHASTLMAVKADTGQTLWSHVMPVQSRTIGPLRRNAAPTK